MRPLKMLTRGAKEVLIQDIPNVPRLIGSCQGGDVRDDLSEAPRRMEFRDLQKRLCQLLSGFVHVIFPQFLATSEDSNGDEYQ
jgi:hypothetical protein